MVKGTLKFLAIAGGVAVLALAIGIMALGITSRVRAQESDPDQGTGIDLIHRGGPGLPGRPDRDRMAADEYLAEALGISVTELQAAQQAAREAAQVTLLDQAVDAGLLTQEQADALQSLDIPLPFRFKGEQGRDYGAAVEIDHQALLAEALGISVEELETAQEAARAARLDQAVADGYLTEEELALMEARRALKDTIDPQVITAEALGISVEELQSYQESGTAMRNLLTELDLTLEDFRAALQEANQAAINQAVADGIITQEQADLLSDPASRMMMPFGRHGGRGGRQPFREMPFDFHPVDPNSSSNYLVPQLEGTSL